MNDAHQKFLHYLESNNQRYTKQKKQIFEAVMSEDSHIEIDELISKFFLKGKRFSRATVYRTIKQLLDANLIQKISTKEGKVFYEYSSSFEHHDHIICNNCGNIFEIKNQSIRDLINDECEKINFLSKYRSIHVYGNCESCR